MIDSTSSPDRAARTSALSAELLKSTASRAVSDSDRLSTEKAQQLSAALANQPEIRPEMVARGQVLAADPSYPSGAIVDQLAAVIVNSPDLSEDES